MRQRQKMLQVLATAAAAAPALRATPAAHAATDVYTGAVLTPGQLYNNSSAPFNISYGGWDTTAGNASNFTPTYTTGVPSSTTPGDDVVFNDGVTNPNNASGINYISVQSTAQTPDSIAFNHTTGGATSTFIFLRASTSTSATSTTSNTPGFTDSFSSTTPFGNSSNGGASIVLLNPGFQGLVDFQARANSLAVASTGTYGTLYNGVYQSANISSGTLEIEDALALPGDPNKTSQITSYPNILLSGGTFNINITDGSAAPQAPGSSNLAGVLSVSANSQLTNGQTSTYYENNFYAGTVDIDPGVTLTVNPGVGIAGKFAFTSPAGVGKAGGTVFFGAATGFVRTSAVLGTSLNFNLGTGSVAYEPGGNGAFGSLSGGANTALYGSNNNATTSVATDIETIGALNVSSGFSGTITNAPYVSQLTTAVMLRPASVTKTGTATLLLSGNNLYAGGTTVNNGTLQAGSVHAFSDSAAPIALTTATAVLDYNGFSPVAGSSYNLAGGSLVNNNGSSPVTLATAASANLTNALNGATSFGANIIAGSGTTPSVAISGGGGAGAAATALLQLNAVTYTGAGGSGYTSSPTVSVSAPGTPGGRTAVVYATISGGSVNGFTVIDPGSGYTSVPTITSISGGGGSGAAVGTVYGVITGFQFSSGGVGYTSAPTVTVSNVGSGGIAPTGVTGGFGQVGLAANSSIGGTGSLTVNPVIAGVGFGLTKIGSGTTTFGGLNTYSGFTNVSAGVLATDVNGTLGTGNVTVGTASVGATLTLGNASSIGDAATLSLGDSSKVNLNAANGTTETLAGVFDLTTTVSVAPGVYTAAQLDTALADSVFSSQFGETVTIVAATPEPTSLLLAGVAAAPLVIGRRRRRQAAGR
jgi:autotransporter-associated beta strand protein